MEKYSMKSAIVNGSLGSIGLALINQLLARKVKVYAIAFPGDPRIELIPGEAEIVPCDMRQIDALTQTIKEPVDAFFHLAWAGTIGPGRDDMLLQTQNIRCAIEAAQTAKKLGCEVFVGVGSQAEHGRIEGKVTASAPCFPTNGYGMAKLCAGQMTRVVCKQLGIRHVWARVLSVYGVNDGPLSVISVLLDKLFKGEKPVLTAGEQMWDYLYAEDAGDALCCMAESGRDGAIYPVGSGKIRPLREYFEALRDAVDPSLPLGLGEMPYPENQVMHLEADISELQRDTGFAPRTSFEEGIREVVKQYRQRQEEKHER
ncbi:MAG: NAD(P)-dependent oxidoreductase [Clostridia bacterium]|nr:NAD(P)-dependent oxidoreductase [Clostridia bacterium]